MEQYLVAIIRRGPLARLLHPLSVFFPFNISKSIVAKVGRYQVTLAGTNIECRVVILV